MSTPALAVAFIGGIPLIALTGLHLVRRRAGPAVLRSQHDVAGYLVAVVGVMYGVLVASVVIMVWAQFDEARRAVDEEAGNVATLYRLSQGLPEPSRSALGAVLRHYAQVMPEHEWPAMAASEPSPEGMAVMDRLWAAVRDVRIVDDRTQLLQDKLLDVLEAVTALRRGRLIASQLGLSSLVWAVLLAGAAITVAFSYLFGVESEALHRMMVGLLSAMIGLNLFLVAALDRPFTGDLHVSPDAFVILDDFLTQGTGGLP
jgi:hypothetical protein